MWRLGLLALTTLAAVFRQQDNIRDSGQRAAYCAYMLAGSSMSETLHCRLLCQEHNVGDCPQYNFPLRYLHEVIMCVRLVEPNCYDMFSQDFDAPNLVLPSDAEEISAFCSDQVIGSPDGDTNVCQYVCRRLMWTGASMCPHLNGSFVDVSEFKLCFSQMTNGLCRIAAAS